MAVQKTVSPRPFDLGERLKFYRDLRNLSQAELAKKADVSQATIAQIETGRKDPSVKTLRKLAQALDTNIATVFVTEDVHVFDMKKIKSKYRHVDQLTPHLYMALGKVVQYARDIDFLKN